MNKWAKELLFYGGVILIAICVRMYVGGTMLIDGESMEPTFQHHDVVIVDRISYHTGEPKLGDVVIVDDVVDPFDQTTKSKKLIKRVIGLPGDTLEVKNGELIRNGEKITEKYINEKMAQDMVEVTVEKGTVFVMGDNRNNSLDSRILGAFPREQIYGRIVLELFDDVFNTDFKI